MRSTSWPVWTAALAADAAGGLGMLSPRRHVPLNPWHLTERFQLFVLIVLGESVARLISAAALRPWSVPLAVVLTAAVVTLGTLWWAWIRSADHRALDSHRAIAWFAAANLPIVGGIAAASAGLHLAILAADGASTIGIGPRAALYGGVSVCLLASAALPSCTMIRSARVARLATSAAAMGLVFMGAIVIPVYLVPALTLALVLGLAAESTYGSHSDNRRPRVDTRHVIGVAGDDGVPALLGAEHDVNVDDVVVAGARAQQSYAAGDVWRHDGDVDIP